MPRPDMMRERYLFASLGVLHFAILLKSLCKVRYISVRSRDAANTALVCKNSTLARFYPFLAILVILFIFLPNNILS